LTKNVWNRNLYRQRIWTNKPSPIKNDLKKYAKCTCIYYLCSFTYLSCRGDGGLSGPPAVSTLRDLAELKLPPVAPVELGSFPFVPSSELRLDPRSSLCSKLLAREVVNDVSFISMEPECECSRLDI
jgi:hypothetical protein